MKKTNHRVLLAALVLGIVLGVLHPYSDSDWLVAFNKNFLSPIGQIFLRLIFMAVVPLVFSSLALGVYELGQGRGLGKVAWKTLFYTVIASTISVVIGVALVNVLRPGKGFQLDASIISDQASAVAAIQSNATKAMSFSDMVVDLIPKNPIDSATRALTGEMLQLMIFALIFGLALAVISRDLEHENPLVGVFRGVFEVCMQIIGFAMKLAPLGIFAIVFGTVFKFGYGILGSLAFYVATVVIGLLLQQFGVYGFLLKAVAKRSPLDFFRSCREVYLYAFSTASSNATLPLTLQTAEEKLGLSPRVSRFVLTVGSTANQNGTALFEGITVLFLAQVYGVDLTLGQQALAVVMSIVAGIGTAGVPGGSLPLIMILLTQLGIPAEGMGLILGADRFLDMCRTTLNVSGDLVIAALVDKDAR